MFGFQAKSKSRWFTKGSKSNRRRCGLQTRLAVERLEDRSLLSVVIPSVTVMTQNLSLGTDLTPVINAILTGNQTVITSAVTTAWQNVQASKFTVRAATIASQIVLAHPEFVGLQEAALFHVAGAVPTGGDYLQILLDDVNNLLKLQKASYTYKAVAVTNEADLTFSGYTSPGVLQSIELTDRDAILARSDMVVSNAQQQHFVHNIVLPVGLTGQTVTIFRGWESVDSQQGGKQFRVINTHLETGDNLLGRLVQASQATELLLGPARTSLPTILVGDFNADASRPGNLTYNLLVGAGFSDAWTKTHLILPGYTWPLPPVLIGNQRIDLVLFRNGFSAKSTSLVGTLPIWFTTLWPSDHAGVVATLELTSATASTTTSTTSKLTDSLWAAFSTLTDQALGSLSGALSSTWTGLQPKKSWTDIVDQLFAGIV
jgi:endonuclease/exonuclease/phosphatase family metal-dependent hydrolase